MSNAHESPQVSPESTNSSKLRDPYHLDESKVKEPPTSFVQSLRYLGPGFILSASIVGSGELVATTILGAEAGFILLWFIIFSCLVKVTIQLEFGKHAISSGESTMASLNVLPGPRIGNANWSIWTWLLLMIAKMMQVGGIVGGVVLALFAFSDQLDPNDPQDFGTKVTLAFLVAASVSLLIFRGYYQLIEKASIIMIGLFTIFTLMSLLALQDTPFAIQTSEVLNGLTPRIPEAALIFVAIGAFGITGVGGDEIMAYNYWLLEKGYAAYTGPKNDTPEWERRAKGWIKVMYWDAILAMIAYTAVTAMFYLLGAAVLNRQSLKPMDNQLIETLASMYTETLGPGARTTFLIGAVVVLYSTLMAALGAWCRMFADAFGRVGLYRFEDARSRKKAIAFFAWVIPLIWASLFLWMGNPGLMVIVGGLATTVILLIVVFAALVFRYKRIDPRLLPSKIYDIALWVSTISILCVALLGLKKVVTKAVELANPPAESLEKTEAGDENAEKDESSDIESPSTSD